MATKKTLQDIFNDDDPFGLLDVQAPSSSYRSTDERMVSSFEEINTFVEKNGRVPQLNGGVQEHRLASRLADYRNNADKREQLLSVDRFNLLTNEVQSINSLDDIFEDDELGIFDDDSGLFNFNHVQRPDERASADFVARRKMMHEFEKYKQLFVDCHRDLNQGNRKLVKFHENQIQEGAFFLLNGMLLYVEKLYDITIDKFGKRDGRTKLIFENGTGSNMLFRSLGKGLFQNGQGITFTNQEMINQFDENYNFISDADQHTGFIYVLKSKSENPEIKTMKHLYKIGFTTTTVEERIKNAINDPTYLMAGVEIVMTFKCYNMNTFKFEKLLHNFFGNACLEIEVFDQKGFRHTPREWFAVTLSEIEEFVERIL